jgi:Ca-activated chloride channel family protein
MPCEVVSLTPISKNKTINVSIVLDHSGSMLQDVSQLFDPSGRPRFYFDYRGQLRIPSDYKTPLEHAQRAVKSFIRSFNTEKDLVCVTGFSSTVSERVPLTHDADRVVRAVETMIADGGTALYDAMIAGMDQLADTPGIKVLVVMTDGEDNVSKHIWQDVVSLANEQEVQVYIIGLGDVNAKRLRQIASQTGGEFRHTRNSASLNSIYAAIGRRIQAFYELVYLSPNLSSADSTRSIALTFDIPDTYLVSNPRATTLPREVITVLNTRERNRDYLMYGGMLLVTVVSGGSLIYLFKRKRRENKIEEV